MKVPFYRPTVVGGESEAIETVLRNGQLGGGGHYTQRAQAILTAATGCRRAFLTTSCTSALEMSALLLELEPGDEVVIPSFCFVSAANAFVLRGAKPVFADIRSDTLNIDEQKLPEVISERTRAIVVMHYAGVGCAMDHLEKIRQSASVSLIEDNAHGLLGSFEGKALGSFGRFATQSFHQTKNFTCGEGGALLLNEPADIARAEVIWEKGTNRLQFMRGQVEKYSWVDLGSSFLPAEVLAAHLVTQLEAQDQIQAVRRRIWERYATGLASWADENGIRLPVIPPACGSAYHLFYLLMPSTPAREVLMERLAEAGIQATFHYVPLHSSPMGKYLGKNRSDCPVAEEMSGRVLRLPFYNALTEDEQDYVIEAVVGNRF